MPKSLCDSNVWLALSLSGHSHHQKARNWLDTKTEPNSVLFCRSTQTSFLRLLTIEAVLGAFGNPPLTNSAAWDVYSALQTDYRISLTTEEPAGTEAVWRRFALRDSASPRVWIDAYLAAFAFAGEFQMVTLDKGFRQYDGLDLLLID